MTRCLKPDRISKSSSPQSRVIRHSQSIFLMLVTATQPLLHSSFLRRLHIRESDPRRWSLLTRHIRQVHAEYSEFIQNLQAIALRLRGRELHAILDNHIASIKSATTVIRRDLIAVSVLHLCWLTAMELIQAGAATVPESILPARCPRAGEDYRATRSPPRTTICLIYSRTFSHCNTARLACSLPSPQCAACK